MSTILYGIPNCDTIKKAKKWLVDNDIAFTFHDYRKDGIDNDFLVRAESELAGSNAQQTRHNLSPARRARESESR